MTDVPRTLSTERLSFRPVTTDDSDDMYLLYGSPQVMAGFRTTGPYTVDESRARVEQIAGHWEKRGYGRYHLSLVESGEFVGRAGLEHSAELMAPDLGYSLLPEWWGRGLATEAARALLRIAFDALRADRVVAQILPGNVRSQRVAERLGFERIPNETAGIPCLDVFELTRAARQRPQVGRLLSRPQR